MENDIKRRIYNCLNPFSVPMMEFLKLTEIEFSNEVATACVTCENRPKLLLNKNFINEYCKTDEHLFMLLMHEMYHIILGHTKLFKRVNEIDNIVFDAVINSMLCRSFNDEAYISFFKNINSSKSFPSCILRPKDRNTPKKYFNVLDSLYESNKGTYVELYELLINELKNIDLESFILVGNHLSDEYSDVFNDLYRKIVDGWPREKAINGRDEFGELVVAPYRKNKIYEDRKNKFYKFLKKEGLKGNNSCFKDYCFGNNEYTTFIPSIKDRTCYAKKMIYNSILYKNIGNIYKKDLCEGKAFIYFDVSGSVIDCVGNMMYLLEEPIRKKKCELYSFSTEVKRITLNNLKESNVSSTYGTDINCCFEHFFSKKRNVKKIIIITDGYTGKTDSRFLDKLKGIKISCVLFGKDILKNDLKNIVKDFMVIR